MQVFLQLRVKPVGKHLKETEKIRKLSTERAPRRINIPLKIIKNNGEIFGSYLFEFFSDCIKKGIFPLLLNMQKLCLFSKMGAKGLKKTTTQ